MNINGENSNNVDGNEMGTENGKIGNSSGTNKNEIATENGKIGNSSGTNKTEMYVLKPAFLQLLKTVGATGITFTFPQVVEHMQNYIFARQLFDPLNPRTIHCKDDELGNVLGVQKFTISEVINVLRSVLFRLPHPDKNGSTSSVCFLDSMKRRVPVSSDDATKRLCIDIKDEQSKPVNPILIYIPDPPKFESASETELSAQGYETSLVRNSSYDSWVSDDDCDLEEEDVFSVEYDVRSLSSDNASVVSDTDSDVPDVIHATIILRKNDTDVEFWADDSSDDSSDPELSEGDKWACNACGSLNRPPMRFCQRCWEERIGWLPSKRLHQHPPRNLRRRQRHNLASSQKLIEKVSEKVEANLVEYDVKSDSEISSVSNICRVDLLTEPSICKKDILSDPILKKEATFDSSIGESATESQLSLGSATSGTCPLCLYQPKNATIIHGKTGHQMCCYPCARQLQSKKLPCPICRRTIQKVVRNYIV